MFRVLFSRSHYKINTIFVEKNYNRWRDVIYPLLSFIYFYFSVVSTPNEHASRVFFASSAANWTQSERLLGKGATGLEGHVELLTIIEILIHCHYISNLKALKWQKLCVDSPQFGFVSVEGMWCMPIFCM